MLFRQSYDNEEAVRKIVLSRGYESGKENELILPEGAVHKMEKSIFEKMGGTAKKGTSGVFANAAMYNFQRTFCYFVAHAIR